MAASSTFHNSFQATFRDGYTRSRTEPVSQPLKAAPSSKSITALAAADSGTHQWQKSLRQHQRVFIQNKKRGLVPRKQAVPGTGTLKISGYKVLKPPAAKNVSPTHSTLPTSEQAKKRTLLNQPQENDLNTGEPCV